jgi:hypothetical protein
MCRRRVKLGGDKVGNVFDSKQSVLRELSEELGLTDSGQLETAFQFLLKLTVPMIFRCPLPHNVKVLISFFKTSIFPNNFYHFIPTIMPSFNKFL